MMAYDISQKMKLRELYQQIRAKTLTLCQPLSIEDYVIQSIEDTSPPKWHLAHTTWFFETFILNQSPTYQSFNSHFHYLFNSYYQGEGKPYPRHQRGLLSRPSIQVIYRYRQYVDQCLLELLENADEKQLSLLNPIIVLGLHHEQQHQELLLMDIKHNFSIDPSYPSYHKARESFNVSQACEFIYLPGGKTKIGYEGNGFCFDNELPAHDYLLNPFLISSQLVTNGEFLSFIESDGYQNFQWWLSDGFDFIQKNNIHSPLYWKKIDNEWFIFTLSGLKKLNLDEPVSHISFFEADAYAKWKGKRLPTEMEWEFAVKHLGLQSEEGNFLEVGLFHPQPTHSHQFFGDLWEWTKSAYLPFPGFKVSSDRLAEYNEKFMNNQMVLKGGSCITPASHIRASYRNFFQPDKRWQFSGIRLASDA